MTSQRALVLPGLMPLGRAELDAVLEISDSHLEAAAEICGFDPARTATADGSQGLAPVVHEALLAVAVFRRMEREGERWAAYGGLSAGCLPALSAAGVVSEEECFRLIREINSRQAAAHRSARSGSTLSVLANSADEAHHLVGVVRVRERSAWLAVDLGGGLVSISVQSPDPGPVTELLARLGLDVVDIAERAEHCPYAVPGQEEFAEFLDGITFREADVPVISPLDGKPVDNSPWAYRDMITRQWLDTASMPRLVQGLCETSGVQAVDLIGPAVSVYRNRVRSLVTDGFPFRMLAFSD
ncbi:hypothetical protein QIS99_24645 [Streptomyces sp. B-S-A8]|uniref:ACP S-malonyltransferase n=1 Tax=Streptomyces solicavernae TaxID=3043614 RepID=A0ABT6RY53_9ACTN|nr:hypothetical protein [Streptomyces sp. B-S-A8]MDI3389361.1 hypothetical protein [Streptomyces sp. B-S-A8]